MYKYDIEEIKPFFVTVPTKTAALKKDLKCHIAQKIITFDIETTSVLIDKDIGKAYDYMNDPVRYDKSLSPKKRDKLLKKKIDNCWHLSFMYIWQMCIADEEDDVIYESWYGRSWDEFKDLISFLKSFDGCTWVIWVHNLGFEFEFIRDMFTWDEQFFTHKHRPIWVKTDNIIFRCSYKMSGMSLKSTAESWKCENQKGSGDEFNYDLYRHNSTVLSPKEFEYCEYDVLTLAQYIHKKWKTEGSKKNLWSLPLTATGEPRKHIKNEIDNEHKKGQLYPKIANGMLYDYEGYLTVKCAMKGGYTHTNPRYYSEAVFAEPSKGVRIFSRDKTSFYPYIMLTKLFPYHMEKIQDSYINKALADSDRTATIFTVHFKGLRLRPGGFPYHSIHKGCINGKSKDTHFKVLYHDIDNPADPKLITDNGKLIYADDVIDIITDVDWKVYEANYTWEDCEKYNAISGYKERLPLPYIISILDWYEVKTIYKGNDEKIVIYQNAKGKINAVFGMSCTDPCKISVYYLNGVWASDSDAKDFNIKDVTEHTLSEQHERYTKISHTTELCNLYQWGCYITAYARGILMEHNKFLGEECTLYNDTDSTYYCTRSEEDRKRIDDYFDDYHRNVIMKEINDAIAVNNERMANNQKWKVQHSFLTLKSFAPENEKGESFMIGLMDIEHEIKAFKALGAKRYCYIYYDKKKDKDIVLPTVAGISKAKMRAYLLEEIGEKQFYTKEDMERIMSRFTNDTYVGMFESGKNAAHYHDAMPDLHIELTDHNGLTAPVEIGTGACFLKVSFSMKENNMPILKLLSKDSPLDDMLDTIDSFDY